ncbi:hypothetical protein J0A67_07590 [Algoriphagus aestuariicola]|jgi:hypothetical protein|uniref:VLRF1 domain-containing protein n=1 Tax=Algoriphagus aestuariicola TaxID=1852016 RepID=A0ABS3BN39_9BACT|nr:hypothetical protein [Algoriphagus aestuariicola]MBN7800718.1 hypothetical protein [Algoriphagus aestuariicola]
MNIPQAREINRDRAESLLAMAAGKGFSQSYLAMKHQLIIEGADGWLAKIYLPLTQNWLGAEGFSEKSDSHFSLVLIRAGQAAVGYFHQGALLDHKVLRAYMVRQKQGFSQIKHLKTKGKSRAGSRIRLAETQRFFEEINERLNSYAERFPMDFWGISCAKTMWPFYFDSSIPPPFSQKDQNLLELPMHISQASYEELVSAGALLGKFHLLLSGRGKAVFGDDLDKVSDIEDEDNW